MAQIYSANEQYVPLSVFADQPMLRLAPEDHPNMVWNELNSRYNHWWSYWKGYVLNKVAKDGKSLIYPVKLNIVRSAVILHASALLGQFTDRIATFGVSDALGVEKSVAQETSKVLNLLWAINNGDSLLLEQALFQQIMGGFYWKIAWTPTRKKWPIRYFVTDPRACYPVWDGDDYDRLVSIEVQHQIPKPTAVARFRIPQEKLYQSAEFATVRERWDETSYEVTVDGEVAKWPDGSEMAGANPFFDEVMGVPIIPYVYCPRIRVGEFYGESLIPGLTGPQNEINNNLAHLIEGLADAMHQQPWVRNRPKGAAGFHNDRNKWLDLGMPQMGGDTPEVGRLEGADLTDPMIALVTQHLVQLAREHSNVPDVAWGRTDASVRSALTLAFMLKPVVDIGNHYRMNASRAFKQLAYYSLVIANSKQKLASSINGVEDIIGTKVSPDMTEAVLIGHKTTWPPMLPNDREQMVNEVVQRIACGTLSVETAIRRLDGPDELQEELDRIEADKQAVLEEQMAMAEQQGKMADEQADKDMERSMEQAEHKNKLDIQRDKAKPRPKDRTNRAQASGGRAKGRGK
jgi:hypothetical protein